MRFYADATALIGLARIGRLDLLSLLPTPVYVTALVWAEVTGNPAKPGAAAVRQARAAGLLAVVDEGNPETFPHLDPGGSTVLTAAAAARAAVIVDERKARALARTDPRLRDSIREAVGIVGLILVAKRRGYIPAVKPVLDNLADQGFWLDPQFRQRVLAQAGEL